MAYADLGVRLILQDGASAGFGALGVHLTGLHGLVGALAGKWNSLSTAMKGTAIAAGGAGILFGVLSHLLGDAVDAAKDLDAEMARVSNSVNGADAAGDQMKTTLITLADQSIYSTAAIADAFAQIGVDGWNADDIMQHLGHDAVILSEAMGQSGTTAAANLLATAMEMFHAKAAESTQYMNDLTFAFYNGQKTIENLQQAINMVGPTAHSLGIDFGQLSDVLALLGEDGLKGSQGASALNYYLTSLSSPIAKASKELANLGLVIVNQNVPAMKQFTSNLNAAANAAGDAPVKFDGTLTSLSQMFTQAQKLGTVHTDKTFLEWATSVGVVSSKLYDAKGNFIGLTDSLELLGKSLEGLTTQQKITAIQNLFNVRSGRAARDMLNDITNSLNRLGKLDAIRQNTEAQQKADKVTHTLAGTMQRLGSTWTDTLARIGGADVGPLSGGLSKVADALHLFNIGSSSLHDNVGIFLVVATAISGLLFIVGGAVVIFTMFGGVLAPVLGIFGLVVAVVGVFGAAFLIAKNAIADNSSVLGGVLRPAVQAVGSVLQWFGGFIRDELLPTLGKFGGVLNVLKPLLIFGLAVAVAPVVLALGLIVGAVIAVTFVVTKLLQVFVWLGDNVPKAVGGILGFFGSLPSRVGGALSAFGTFVHSKLTDLGNGVHKFITDLQTRFQQGFNRIKDAVTAPFRAIGALFSWLYNHNYYVQALVDIVRLRIALLVNHFIAVKNQVTKVWNDTWAKVREVVGVAWAWVQGKFEWAKAMLAGAASGAKAAVVNPITQLKNQTIGIVQTLWDVVVGKFSHAKAVLGEMASGIKSAVFDPIQHLGTLLLNAGKNMISMLIQGINSKLGDLKKTVGDVAGSITKALGFHSPPAEGPLSDSDRYMPNMMRMYAGGITDHAHLVHGAVDKVAVGVSSRLGNVHVPINAAVALPASAQAALLASHSAQQPPREVHNHFHVDGKEVMDSVHDEFGRQLRTSGFGRKLR